MRWLPAGLDGGEDETRGDREFFMGADDQEIGPEPRTWREMLRGGRGRTKLKVPQRSRSSLICAGHLGTHFRRLARHSSQNGAFAAWCACLFSNNTEVIVQTVRPFPYRSAPRMLDECRKF